MHEGAWERGTAENRTRSQGIPVIYVNDNYGRWRSDFHRLVRHCLNDGVRGERVARVLQPQADDYFVLKPKHSGFFATALELLLDYLGAGTLILTGFAGNICVLFTAHDAHMRDFRLVVPGDCLASNTTEANDFALRRMAEVLSADVTPSPELDLDEVLEVHVRTRRRLFNFSEDARPGTGAAP